MFYYILTLNHITRKTTYHSFENSLVCKIWKLLWKHIDIFCSHLPYLKSVLVVRVLNKNHIDVQCNMCYFWHDNASIVYTKQMYEH